MIQYAKDRDEAIVESIRTDSVEPFKKFIEKYSIIFPDCFKAPSDEILAISISTNTSVVTSPRSHLEMVLSE